MSKLKFLLAAVLLAIVIAGAGAVFVYRFNQPVGSEGKVEFTINPGESVQQIGEKLDEAQLINSTAFVLYVRFKNLTTKIQAGRYEIPLTLSPAQIVALLQHGTFDVRLTFLEGWRREQFLEYALSKLAVDDDTFSAEFLTETKGLEGYLFPDTYSVSISITAKELVEKLRANFDKRYGESGQPLEKKSGLSRAQIVNIAAMLERETLNDTAEELQTIAGIIIKRWKSGWRLDVDATIQYVLGYQEDTAEWWTEDQAEIVAGKKIDSPYNTYRYKGLTPGPIANPGLNTLVAVGNYTKNTPYWYYLHCSDGQVRYARTLDEQIRNQTCIENTP